MFAFFVDILMQYSRGKSALVFCATRKGAQEAAQKISQTAMAFGYSNPFIKTKEQQERLREASLSCSDKQLQSYVLYGGKCQLLKLFVLSETFSNMSLRSVQFIDRHICCTW